ncbi:MAG: hypothetical protein Q9195_003639 [Heterodermia aff. obscurata]
MTFTDLATITAPTTITTPIMESLHDGSRSTRSPGTVIVGPGGIWIAERNEKRALPTPVYGVKGFVEWQTDRARKVPHGVWAQSTALIAKLVNENDTMAVTGLHGCTSVIVASKKAIYMSHLWQVPSFESFQPWVTRENELAITRDQIIDPLIHGAGAEMPGLISYTGAGEAFADDTEPVIIIVTPRKPGAAPHRDVWRRLKFPEKVNIIVQILQNYIQQSGPNTEVEPLIVDYVASTDPDKAAREDAISGKVLFQYDPAQAMVPEPRKPCRSYQQAMFRLWVGDAPTPALEKSWRALPEQIVSRHGKRVIPTAVCQQRSTRAAGGKATKGSVQ